MSILLIKNGYCCGHGQIIHRLENWCIANNIEYQIEHTSGESAAIFNNKEVILSPNSTLNEVIKQLKLLD